MSDPCRRFESEGLLVLQQGGTLDAHFASCPDCRTARAAHEGLARRLGALHRSGPPDGWQAGVWAAVDGARPGRSSVLPWLAAAAVLVLAAGFGIRALRQRVPAADVLSAAVEAAPNTYRGRDGARPGDVLVLRAQVGGARVAELRLYQDDRRLAARCGTEAPCVRRDGTLEARFTLAAAGSYQPVLVLSERALPPPTGALDADAGTAHASGARVVLGERVLVR